MALIADSVENRQSWRHHLKPTPRWLWLSGHRITPVKSQCEPHHRVCYSLHRFLNHLAPCRTRSSHSIQAYAKLGSMSPSEVPAFPPSPHLGLWAALAAILCRYSKMQGAHSTLELAVNDDFSFLHLSPESFHIFTSQFIQFYASRRHVWIHYVWTIHHHAHVNVNINLRIQTYILKSVSNLI